MSVTLGSGRRQMGLYTILEDLVPGLVLVFGLVPFFPKTADVGLVGTLLPVIVLAWVVGRVVHVVAMEVDSRSGVQSHREAFVSELLHPELLHPTTVFEFYRECCTAFDVVEFPEEWSGRSTDSGALPDDWIENLTGDDSADTETKSDDIGRAASRRLGTLYQLVRSYLHVDGRGRFRAMETAYTSFRGLVLVGTVLSVTYFAYGLSEAVGVVDELVSYDLVITSVTPHPVLIAAIAGVLWAVLGLLARRARTRLADGYASYVITDFITLRKSMGSVV